MCVGAVHAWCLGRPEKVLNPLRLELQTDVRCLVDAGNWTQHLWKRKPVVLITRPAFQPANFTLLKWSYILWKFCNPPMYQEFICSTFGELLQVSKKGGRKPISMRWECVQRTEVRTRLHWSSFIGRSLGSKPHMPFSILGGAIGKMVTDCD